MKTKITFAIVLLFLFIGVTYSYEPVDLKESLMAMSGTLAPALEDCTNVDAYVFKIIKEGTEKELIVIRQICSFVDQEIGFYGEIKKTIFIDWKNEERWRVNKWQELLD